jgi:hypothetical protein
MGSFGPRRDEGLTGRDDERVAPAMDCSRLGLAYGAFVDEMHPRTCARSQNRCRAPFFHARNIGV